MTTTQSATDARSVALEVLARLETAWNGADGAAYGSAYTPDASFVTVNGEHLVGASAIGAGHAGIFATIYAGSVNRMELVRVREVAENVVLAVSLHTLDCPTGPFTGRRQAMSTSVLVRSADGDRAWAISATHNTLVAA